MITGTANVGSFFYEFRSSHSCSCEILLLLRSGFLGRDLEEVSVKVNSYAKGCFPRIFPSRTIP